MKQRLHLVGAGAPEAAGTAAKAVSGPGRDAPALSDELWLCVYLPRLAVDALEPRGDAAVVVIEEIQGRMQVLACNREAAGYGICPQMTLAAALALQPETQVQPRDPALEQRLLDRLAQSAFGFSSRVAIYAGHSVVLEIRRSLRLFGGLEALLQRVRHGLNAAAFDHALAVSPTPRASLWLAREQDGVIVPHQRQLASALGGLCVHTVARGRRHAQRLQRSGILTLADLMRLPRDGVARRFGASTLQTLDQAIGRRPEVPGLYRPPQAFRMEYEFYRPTRDIGQIMPPVRELLQQLQTFLRLRQAAVQQFRLELAHRTGVPSRCGIECREATCRAEHMGLLLEEKLDRLSLRDDIVSVALVSGLPQEAAPQQPDLFGPPAETGPGWAGLMEQFEARLGSTAFVQLSTRADHRPEYAFSSRGAAQSTDAGHPAPRPLWLLESPQRLAIEAGRPCWQGGLRMVRCCERIEQGWWDGRDVRRDYWVAENRAGSRLWIYRNHRNGHWFLHGVFA